MMDKLGLSFLYPVILFIAVFIFTLSSFIWVKKLLKDFSPSPFPKFIFGIVNGLAAVFVQFVLDLSYPSVMMVIIPVLLILEFRIVTRDRPWAYLFIFSAFLLNFSLVYDLMVGIFGIISFNTEISRVSTEYRVFVLTAASLLCTVMLIVLKKFVPSRELCSVIHAVRKSAMLVAYMLICGVALLITSTITASVMMSDFLPALIMPSTIFDTVIKDLVLLICSYVIVLMQSKSEGTSQLFSEKKRELMREREYRSTIQQNYLMSYCFNSTTNRVIEGLDGFDESLYGEPKDDYKQILVNFAKICVHPDDSDIIQKSAYNVTAEQIKSGHNMQRVRFRMSMKRFQEITHNTDIQLRGGTQASDWRWTEARAALTIDAASQDILVYIDLVDAEEIVENEQRLISTRYDSVTGILSRAAMESSITEALMRDDAKGAMLMIDIDNFKEVNDTFGHQRGDELLKEISAEIKAVFCSVDIIGRLGGDEFCVYTDGLDDYATITKKASDLVSLIRHTHLSSNGEAFDTTVSVGIAFFPKDGTDYHTLYRHSDSALYQSKLNGKNTFSFYKKISRK